MVATANLGRTGHSLARVGLGTADFHTADRRAIVRLVHGALDLGVDHIDTAEAYGDNEVERILGEALAGRRAQAFVTSKVMPDNARTYEGTIAACEASLGRLGTDYLDLYLLHWPERAPLGPTFEAFEQLQHEGKIRAYGVSNFDIEDLQEAFNLVGHERIACNQVIYHLGERYIERYILPFCEAHGVAVVGYSPFGGGEDLPPADSGFFTPLHDIGREHGATAWQIMLAYLLRRPSSFTIPQSHDIAHVAANARAADIVLSEAEVLRIQAAFPVVRRNSLPTR